MVTKPKLQRLIRDKKFCRKASVLHFLPIYYNKVKEETKDAITELKNGDIDNETNNKTIIKSTTYDLQRNRKNWYACV